MPILTAGQISMMLSRMTPFNGKIPMGTAGEIITIGSIRPSKTSTTQVKPSQFATNPEMLSRQSKTNGRTWTAMVGVTTKPVSINQTPSHSNLLNGMTSMVMAMAITASLTPMAKKARSGPRVRLSLMLAVRSTATSILQEFGCPDCDGDGTADLSIGPVPMGSSRHEWCIDWAECGDMFDYFGSECEHR